MGHDYECTEDDVKRILISLGIVWSRSILDYEDENRLIILDPKAEETLRRDYINNDDYLVIGGILGDYPPKGRTYKYITKKIIKKYPKVRRYNLGKYMFPIDSAAIVAYLIWRGEKLEDIPVINELHIKHKYGEVILPFSYPLIHGKPFINPILMELLKVEEPLNLYSSIWKLESHNLNVFLTENLR